MDISGRKLKILNIIIDSYMMTGEPVGSRTISKNAELSVSPATIRNEMADLEDLGYIVQPYTSAGRIPTDKAYRLYVDNLLKEKSTELTKRETELNDRDNLLNEKVDKLERLLHKIAVLLADNTNYTTLVTRPSISSSIKFTQLSMLDDSKLILVCVTQDNIIKNQIIDVGYRLDEKELLKLNFVFNSNLNGKNPENIGIKDIAQIKQQLNIDDNVISLIFDALGRAFYADNEFEIYTGGTTNILKYPELSDKQNFEGLLTELVEKEELSKFMSKAQNQDSNIQIYIGDESKITNMDNCSVVTMNFNINKGMKSTIGIIGPKRMDYEKVLDNLEEIKIQINKLFDD